MSASRTLVLGARRLVIASAASLLAVALLTVFTLGSRAGSDVALAATYHSAGSHHAVVALRVTNGHHQAVGGRVVLVFDTANGKQVEKVTATANRAGKVTVQIPSNAKHVQVVLYSGGHRLGSRVFPIQPGRSVNVTATVTKDKHGTLLGGLFPY